MDNLSIYEKVRKVPQEAQKKIQGGSINGFTDINPMWRIKTLTDTFGPCGIGWYTEIVSQWLEKGDDGKTAAFCNINLYVKHDGEWSKPISGTGGSMFTNMFKDKDDEYKLKPSSSDECFKMAHTDAISVACKMLGIGADVYWEKDKTKYDNTPSPTPPVTDKVIGGDSKVAPQCAACQSSITEAEHDYSVSKYKKPLCRACQKKQ